MTPLERSRLGAARVGRLATVRPDGFPHLVAVTFAAVGDTVVTAVDSKPKVTTDLQRLRNIESQPRVVLLVDFYDEDWSKLWWVRVDGDAQVVREEPRRTDLIGPLVDKYEQYADAAPAGPVILITVRSTVSWSADSGFGTA